MAAETMDELLRLELRAHPDQAVSLEVSELPDDLRQVLDNLAADTERFTYIVVDRLSEFDSG